MSDLRKHLREAAESHQPDRARMLARVERAMEGTRGARKHRGPTLAWPRVALAAVAAAGACVVGGFAVAFVVQGEERHQQKASTSALPQVPDITPSPDAPTEGPVAAPSGNPDSTPSTRRPSEPAGRTSPQAGTPPAQADHSRPPASGGTRTTDGPLWADGSVVPDDKTNWAQSNVTLKTQEPLTALTVELFVAQTGEVRSTERWQSLPAENFTRSLREQDGMLVHRWTLKAGSTVPPGTHVFAGQYSHASDGRDAKDDTYEATAKTANDTFTVGGDFARTN